MTDATYKTETFKIDHRIFGGEIYQSDFNTNYSGKKNLKWSPIAGRIAKDKKEFDELCKKNIKQTNNNNK